MDIDLPDPQELHAALDAFIQTTTMEEGLLLLDQHPDLLGDQADQSFPMVNRK